MGPNTRVWQGIFHVKGTQPREFFIICPWARAKTIIFNLFTYMVFLEFCNNGLSNPTTIFCEGFLLVQPHMFILLFLPIGFGSTIPLVELSNPTSCDPKELGFCDIYTSDEKWEGKKKGVGGGLERYKKYSYNKGA